MNTLDTWRNGQGAWVVATLLNDNDGQGAYYHHSQFYGYTKSEAIAQYKAQYGHRFDRSHQHKECQFCLGENVPTSSNAYNLTPLRYQYMDSGDICEGLACDYCIEFVQTDIEFTTIISVGVALRALREIQ